MAIIGRLKQSTAATVVLGPFVDSTDGVTAETALTISQADVRLSKNAGTFAQVNESTSASHMENGYYFKALNTTDTNTLGRLTITVSEAGALPIRQEYEILPAHEFDAIFTTTIGQMLRGVITWGTAQSATSTTLVLAAGESIPNDTVNGSSLLVYDSTNGFQVRSITDYVLSTDTATVDAWAATPTGTISYAILAGPPASATVLPNVNVSTVTANAITASALATDAVTEIANAVVEGEITAIKTYERPTNLTANITGPTSGVNALGVTVDATYNPLKTL